MLARLPVLAILCCLLAAAPAMAEAPAIDDYAYDPATECRKRLRTCPALFAPCVLASLGFRRLSSELWQWTGRAGSAWEPYSACFTEKGKPRKHVDRTTAHRDHIHFGRFWAGARKPTSFWRPDDD